MRALNTSSRVIKICHNDDDSDEYKNNGTIETSPTKLDENISSQITSNGRKVNVIQAPISRPPSAYGKSTSTKVQKIKPSARKKRHKWDDRFHLQSESDTPPPLPEKQIFQNTHPSKSSNFKSKSSKISYSNMYTNNKKKHKKHSTSSSSAIPPIDIITGRRQWGKRTKKRAKWGVNKNSAPILKINMKRNQTVPKEKPKPQRKLRAKWGNTPLPTENPLNRSRTRLLPLPSKTINSEKTITKNNEPFSDSQKEEFTKLFSDVLKGFMASKESTNLNGNVVDVINQQILKKNEIDQNDKIEEKIEIVENEINKENVIQKPVNNDRVKRKLLPISKRNSKLIEQKKQYLDPLDKVADIILDDLIDEIGIELDLFCTQLVTTLIECEANI